MKKKVIIIIPLLYLFLSCNFAKRNDLDKFISLKELEINSFNDINDITVEKNRLDSNWIKTFFKGTDLPNKNGGYYENMPIEIYSIGKVEINKNNYYFLLKNILLIDGSLQELYVFNVDTNNNLYSLVKLAKHEITDHCTTEFQLKDTIVKQIESCEIYDQNKDDEVEIKKSLTNSFYCDPKNNIIKLVKR